MEQNAVGFSFYGDHAHKPVNPRSIVRVSRQQLQRFLNLHLPPTRESPAQSEDGVGERRLLLAVLQDAVLCFQTYLFTQERHGRTLFREAEQWLGSRESDLLFSFESICEVLGIDAQYLRRRLDHWRQQQVRRVERSHDITGEV
jgi:hypothetical protein